MPSTTRSPSDAPGVTSTPRAEIIVDDLLAGDERLLLETPIAGLPLLDRHLILCRDAGLTDIVVRIPPGRERLAGAIGARGAARDVRVRVVASDECIEDPRGGRSLAWPARLVVDPRALLQAIALARTVDQSIVFVDRMAGQYPPDAKSPYVVGAPDGREGRLIEAFDVEGLVPIGTEPARFGLRFASAGTDPEIGYDLGRYYWHELRTAADAEDATTKILLGTMKPTDGIFARTNRRVSLRITRWLLPTRVTANMATLMVLACSVLAGLVMATGSFVAGALLSWVASMLDGVDGEIARAKLMASEWGHWLEMACDYAFYLAIILGCGVGLARVDGNAAWVQAGVVGAAGVVLAFVTVAGLKRRYGGMEPDGDYYLAFQHTLDVHLRNPVHRFTRRCTFLGTRAVCPYFMFAFALLGLARPMYVFMLVAAQLAWMLSLYSSRLHFSVQPPPEEPLRAVIRTPDVVAAEAVPGES